MKKMILWKILLAAMFLSIVSSAAFAAPVAKVSAFPKGEGLEAFLSRVDSSKISRTERASDLDDTAVVIVPLSEGSSIFGALSKWEDVFVPSGGENIGTFAWRDARVYTEPDPSSRVAGILPKSPEGRDAENPDVFISGWRSYEEPTGRIGSFSIWWRVEKPVKGWVEGQALGAMNSGLLLEF